MGTTSSRSRRIGTIDLDTNEILDGVPVYFNTKVKWREDWFMGFQNSFTTIAEANALGHEAMRVWLFMLGKLAFENFISIEQKLICERLRLKKSNVSRAVKVLVEEGLLIKGPKIGRSHAYRLSSKVGWKGKLYNLQDRRAEGL